MRVSSFVAVFAALLCIPALAQAQNTRVPCRLPHDPGVFQRQTVSEGKRSYRLFVPPKYDGTASLPLVLDLHGSGGNSAGQARTSGFEDVAAKEGFAVATLDADGGRWNVPVTKDRDDDVAYVGKVIDDVAAKVCLDRARVYATGFSGGARMSSLLACKLNNRIAAIAPVSGLRWPSPCEGRAIPVLTFHGLADPQNTYDGHVEGRNNEWVESVPDALAGWAKHNGCNATPVTEDPPGPLSTIRYAGCRDNTEVKIIRIDGLGHTWTKNEVDTTAVMWEFFKSHRLP